MECVEWYWIDVEGVGFLPKLGSTTTLFYQPVSARETEPDKLFKGNEGPTQQ